MITHRIVASLTIALALVSLAIPEAQPAEQRKRMVIKDKKVKPIGRNERHASEKKTEACMRAEPFSACIASCYQDCRK